MVALPDLWVVDHPAPGPAVVLVHGTMDRSSSFARVADELAECHVVRYDRRGYGRSQACGVTDMAGHADDLVDVLVAVGGAVVAGHSLGGDIVLAAAERRPDLVHAAVVYEAPMPWVSWWPSHSAGGDAMGALGTGGPGLAAERFLRRMLGDDRWAAMSPATQEERRGDGDALVAEMQSIRAAEPYALSRVSVPLVVGSGTESRPHHRRAVRELTAAVPGAELVEIPGAGHGAHGSHPVEFAGLVRRAGAHLRELVPRRQWPS